MTRNSRWRIVPLPLMGGVVGEREIVHHTDSISGQTATPRNRTVRVVTKRREVTTRTVLYR